MKIGMLWMDADKDRTLQEKVQLAIAYYEHKYGGCPDLCYVNDAVIEDPIKVDTIEVKPSSYIMVDHLWLGKREGVGQ